jgi:hypothetical protein
MKIQFTSTTLLAPLTVPGLGIAPAMADNGQGTTPNTFFTELSGVIAKSAIGNTAMATAPSDASIGSYAATTESGYEYPDFWGDMPSDGQRSTAESRCVEGRGAGPGHAAGTVGRAMTAGRHQYGVVFRPGPLWASPDHNQTKHPAHRILIGRLHARPGVSLLAIPQCLNGPLVQSEPW